MYFHMTSYMRVRACNLVVKCFIEKYMLFIAVLHKYNMQIHICNHIKMFECRIEQFLLEMNIINEEVK